MSQRTIQDSIIRSPITLTIAAGVIVVTEQYHLVAGAGGLADDLDTINGGAKGARLILMASSDTVSITIKHGTGNIKCHGATDIILAEDDDVAMLIHNGTSWAATPFKVEVDPSLGKAALRTATLAFADSALLGFGNTAAAPDITVTWNATKLVVAQATANSAIDFGVSGAGIDIQLYGDTAGYDWLWDQSASSTIYADNAKFVLGGGGDLTAYHDSTNTFFNSITGNLVFDNQAATGATIMLLGADTSAVSWQVQNNSTAALLTVTPTSASGGTTVASGLRAVSAVAAAITGVTTLTAADSGGVFSVSKASAYAITLPTPAQGMRFKFLILDTGANAVTFSDGAAHLFGQIQEAGTVPIAMTGTTLTAAASGSVGDWLEFVGIDATHYLVTGSSIAASKFTIA